VQKLISATFGRAALAVPTRFSDLLQLIYFGELTTNFVHLQVTALVPYPTSSFDTSKPTSVPLDIIPFTQHRSESLAQIWPLAELSDQCDFSLDFTTSALFVHHTYIS